MLGGCTALDPAKVATYIRWSTDEQGLGTTLEVQRDACEHFIKSQGWTWRADLVFIDEGISGASMERPALQRLRTAVAAGDVGCVVVFKLDRLSRNLLDCVSLVRREWVQIPLYSTKENFDTQSPVGQMVFNMLVSFAEFERNVIRDRTMSGKAKRMEQGRNSGFKYPFGYRKGADGGWAIAMDEAVTVRRIFAEYLGGRGFYDIAMRLTDAGLPTPAGKPLWRTGTVQWILSNPFYAGRFVAGAWKRTDGRYIKGLPKHVILGVVPALIDPAEFDRAQAIRRQRRQMAPRALASSYLLTGILRCQKCGGAMVGHKHSGNDKRFYKCVNVRDTRRCDCGMIPADPLEDQVLAALADSVAMDRLAHHVARVEAQRESHILQHQHLADRHEQGLAAVARGQAKLQRDYLSGELDAHAYRTLTARLDADEAQVRAALGAAQAALRSAQSPAVDIRRLLARASALQALPAEGRRQVLREIIVSVTAYRPKARGRSLPVEMIVAARVGNLPAGLTRQGVEAI